MIIGIPKEIKEEEYRVAAIPSTVNQLVKAGHKVLVEKGAGIGAGFEDFEYIENGAEMIDTAKELWEGSEMIYKVKEPIKEEYGYFREGLIVFCYLHIAANEKLTKALVDKKVVGIAYETVEVNGGLPLLKPMSEIGGIMGVMEGTNLLKRTHGGKGKILQGMPGVPPCHVVVIGAGIAGRGAIRTAVGIGARVTAINRGTEKLSELQDIYGPRLETLTSNPHNIEQALKTADLLIGAVLLHGARAPKVVTEEMVKSMQPGSVIVDISVDQGGCIETIDRYTTHSNPSYEKHGIIHYAVPNIPGTVSETASVALSNETIRYCLEVANKGWKKAALESEPLKKGINTANGHITYKAVAEAFGAEYVPVDEFLN